MKSSRDDFSEKTIRILQERVANRCSNPCCRVFTSGPNTKINKSTRIGVAAHITAASINGPRYDPELTVEQRKSIGNAIWLCQNCAKLIDSDINRFTVNVLIEWKKNAEDMARKKIGKSISDKNIEAMESEIEKAFNVFLSHSQIDSKFVEQLAIKLELEGIRVWLDKWILIPGEHWQQEIEKGFESAETCAVFIGNETPKGWFLDEIGIAQNMQANDKNFRVIPVIIPGGSPKYIGNFLKLRTWVDFGRGINDEDAFEMLLSGITGKPRVRPSYKPKNSRLDSARNELKIIHELKDYLKDEIVIEYQRKVMDSVIKISRG
jgi:hypothetical protein